MSESGAGAGRAHVAIDEHADQRSLVHFRHLTTAQSLTICALLSSLYVLSLYVSTTNHDRNQASTIRRRSAAVAVVCVLSGLVVHSVSQSCGAESDSCATLWQHLIGHSWTDAARGAARALIVTAALFCGPIAVEVVSGRFVLAFSWAFWREVSSDWIFLRNQLVAPITEEFVYRACMLVLLMPNFGDRALFIAPLFFAIAHAHHLIDKLRHGGSIISALSSTALQLVYTSVFGTLSCFLLVRTRALAAPIAAHSLCNLLGLPSLALVRGFASRTTRRCLYVCYLLGPCLFAVATKTLLM